MKKYVNEKLDQIKGDELVNKNDAEQMKMFIDSIIKKKSKEWKLNQKSVQIEYKKAIKYYFQLDELIVTKNKLSTLKEFAEHNL